MRRTHRSRRLQASLAAALGVMALLALPAFAAAKAKDRNHDGIPDRWEKRHHLSLRVNQAHRNQDHEGLNNLEEFENGTNPRDADTDNDELTDSQEVEVGDDPTDSDTDNDGIEDGQENAGTIAEFDGTTLKIALFGGGTLEGQVTESTKIECEHHEGEAQASDDDQSEDSQSEESQSQEEQSGEQASEEAADGGGCTKADLTTGTGVQEADLETTEAGTVFEEIELAG